MIGADAVTGSRYDVFLSYTKEDQSIAQKFFNELHRAGLLVWFDDDCLIGGQRWNSTIKQAIKTCKTFIILISQHWYDRDRYIHDELKTAVATWSQHPDKRDFIIPVLLDNCNLPMPLRRYNIIDISHNWEDGIKKVLKVFINYPTSPNGNVNVVGFDLGHGETASALTNIFSKDVPIPLEIISKTSILTAMLVREDGRVLIGEDVYDVEHSNSLHIFLKSPDFSDCGYRASLKLFIRTYFDTLKETGKLRVDNSTMVVVGTPCGWTAEACRDYLRLFKEEGINNVTHQPESRAALLDAYDSNLISSSTTGGVLLIDIGSLTTDCTFVRDLREKPIEFGNNTLGTGHLDQQIFEYVLRTQYNEHTRGIIENAIRQAPWLKARCLLESAYRDTIMEPD